MSINADMNDAFDDNTLVFLGKPPDAAHGWEISGGDQETSKFLVTDGDDFKPASDFGRTLD